MARIIEKELSFVKITLTVTELGNDINILVSGGTSHIGCCVLAQPRPSLKKDGSLSSTASVINVIGHKDEEICRYIAEKVAAKKNTIVVCCGGIHIDNITAKQIEELHMLVSSLVEEI